MVAAEQMALIDAILCETSGGPRDLRLAQIPAPVPKVGQILIDVAATTANFADLLMIAGQYQTRPAHPFVPGLEAAGTVAEAAPGSQFRRGDRVVAFLWHGGFAQQVCAHEVDTFIIPNAISFETSASLTSTYASAGLALLDVGRLAAGETLLVHGAGGGAGSAAVQIGKAVGARVIAVAGTPDKRALAFRGGADLVLDNGDPGWAEEVARFAGSRGVDVCFDPVGGAIVDRSLSALGWGGRYVVFGFASGEIPTIRVNRLLVKNRALLGSSLRYFRRYKPERLAAMMTRLFDWCLTGVIQPEITKRYPLEQVPEALTEIATRRGHGKFAIHIRARRFEINAAHGRQPLASK